MTQRLLGKTAIVTSAAAGIGLACARRFGDEGANVVLADADEVRGKAAAREMAKRGQQAIFVRTDAAERQALQKLAASAVAIYGALDIMVSNNAIARPVPFLDISDAQYAQMLGENLKAAFICGQEAARQMVRQGTGGVIINLSSVHELLALPGLLAHSLTRGGISQLTQAMAAELAPHNIRVNAIGPGSILTEMARQASRSRDPVEVAAVAAFLASDESACLTGQTMNLDGKVAVAD